MAYKKNVYQLYIDGNITDRILTREEIVSQFGINPKNISHYNLKGKKAQYRYNFQRIGEVGVRKESKVSHDAPCKDISAQSVFSRYLVTFLEYKQAKSPKKVIIRGGSVKHVRTLLTEFYGESVILCSIEKAAG